MNPILLGSLATAMCTAVGALPALFISSMTHRGKDVLLAFTAGIMVSASTYGLIPSALKLSNLGVLTIGILLGTFVLMLLELLIPHTDTVHGELPQPLHSQSGGWFGLDRNSTLFLTAMALHNLPEGLSVGVSYSSGEIQLGPIVAVSIGLQNIPEGFLTALFLITQGTKRGYAVLMAVGTGLLEFIAALLGGSFAAAIEPVVPYGLAFAAGAMLFVVYKELIPESHGDGHARTATLSFIAGLLTMISLTHALG
ncbi:MULTISPECIES: ZIP family metal transporter [unclassified Paenibacillus]|uniref:ZIP family metal transporter n=1 Tax=Paenibacillus TaxID=44249 RepID=UPI00061E1B9B|nr:MULTISPECIES: ZIP family metal transporter [unclassified Paenibacillus]KKC48980.1 dihydroorotate dehydrogenase [Paenibacillus sp. D9]